MDCLHTDELPKKERTGDDELRKISLDQNRIVISNYNLNAIRIPDFTNSKSKGKIVPNLPSTNDVEWLQFYESGLWIQS